MFYNMKVITKTSTEVKQKDNKDTSFLDMYLKLSKYVMVEWWLKREEISDVDLVSLLLTHQEKAWWKLMKERKG